MQDRILLKAKELMFQNGLRQVTMDDLATQLGISKKTIYQYYKDKDDLVKAVVSFELKNHQLMCQNCESNADNAVHEMFLTMETMKEMAKTMNPGTLMELEKYFPSAFDVIKKHKEEFFLSLIKENINKGIEQGFYRNDLEVDVLSKFRLETIFIPHNLNLYPISKFDPIKVHTQLMEHFVYGLMTVKGYEVMQQYKLNNKTLIK
ncbi:MAG: TetR/AcrR family transcriptional regulator [Sediminibacterium sp.]|jgi:AcrR family transcriptional regulator|nr:TetR/AcrR family transcriptional regulator [Sediminibacterium sp.]MBP6145438.1 TetR/AcrR family transcriptional regulator [Sediminibacterium sp.]